MGEVITEYEGSKPGTYHQIIRGADGVVYCSCWAWKRNRRCKHLDRFFASAGVPKPTLPTPRAGWNVKTTSADMKTAKQVIDNIQPSFWSEEDGNENNEDTG